MIRLALLLAAMSLTSCSLFGGKPPEVSPDRALSTTQDACRIYEALPAKYRNERDDKACAFVKRICLMPAELEAEPPSYGSKIVDAGSGGSAQ